MRPLFLHACVLSLVVGSGGYSLAAVSRLLIAVASCGAQAQLSRGTWGLPKAEVEPVSRIDRQTLKYSPPGKSWNFGLKCLFSAFCIWKRLYNMTYRELVFELDFETWEWLDRRGVDTQGWNGGKPRPGRGRAGSKQTRDWTRVSCVSWYWR